MEAAEREAKQRWVDELREQLADLVDQLVPTVHSEAYVHALKPGRPTELAESQGFGWDEGIWEMAANSTAGVLAATNEALAIGGPSGSLSSGLHHARRANRSTEPSSSSTSTPIAAEAPTNS